MRPLQVALCLNKFKPGDNRLCSSLPLVTLGSTLFLNKLAKTLQYSSDPQLDLVIFMVYEIDRSDVLKQMGRCVVEFAKQRKSNHNRMHKPIALSMKRMTIILLGPCIILKEIRYLHWEIYPFMLLLCIFLAEIFFMLEFPAVSENIGMWSKNLSLGNSNT